MIVSPMLHPLECKILELQVLESIFCLLVIGIVNLLFLFYLFFYFLSFDIFVVRGRDASLNNPATMVYEDVFNAYRVGASRQEGMHYGEILQVLRGKGVNLNQEMLIRVVQQLCNDGRLYTTIDEEHYRPTVDDF